MYDLAPIRDTGLNNALKLTDQEVETLSPLRLPAVHKRLDIAYGTAELPALVFNSIKLHELRMAAHAPGKLFPIEGADHFSILGELRRPDGALVDIARKLVLVRLRLDRVCVDPDLIVPDPDREQPQRPARPAVGHPAIAEIERGRVAGTEQAASRTGVRG